MEKIIVLLKKYRVVPVIAIDHLDDALPLADALLEGGLPLAEITFRTSAAASVMSLLTEKRPELIVGAGTVLTPNHVDAAIQAKARFGVAPGLNRDTVELAQDMDWPFIPGVCTPSEIETALALNCRVVKFFPAGAMGGVAMLKALSAPYAHTGIQYMPTGGVTESNLTEYLALPNVLACGGTWIAGKDDIASGNWKEIQERCRRAVGIVQS